MVVDHTNARQDIWLETTTDLVIDVPRVAAVLGIGRSTAYEAVRSGEIPSIRLGRRVVVPVHKLRLMLGVQYLEAPHGHPNSTQDNN